MQLLGNPQSTPRAYEVTRVLEYSYPGTPRTLPRLKHTLEALRRVAPPRARVAGIQEHKLVACSGCRFFFRKTNEFRRGYNRAQASRIATWGVVIGASSSCLSNTRFCTGSSLHRCKNEGRGCKNELAHLVNMVHMSGRSRSISVILRKQKK